MPEHLGDKHEAKDFLVKLLETDEDEASFYVQVKSTSRGYSGTGSSRRLRVKVSKADVRKLRRANAPVYVVGIDVELGVGFRAPITASLRGGLNGIPTRHKLDCRTIRKLWREVVEYWRQKNMLPSDSRFE